MSSQRSLDRLLVSQLQADFLRSAETLTAIADRDRLARWWVFMNGYYWPDDVEDPIPLKLHDTWNGMQCKWAQEQVFRLIEARVDADYLTLHWRAAGNASDRLTRIARAELAFKRKSSTEDQPQ